MSRASKLSVSLKPDDLDSKPKPMKTKIYRANSKSNSAKVSEKTSSLADQLDLPARRAVSQELISQGVKNSQKSHQSSTPRVRLTQQNLNRSGSQIGGSPLPGRGKTRSKPDREKKADNSFSLMGQKKPLGIANHRDQNCIVCLKINKSLYQKIFQPSDMDLSLDDLNTETVGEVRSLVAGNLDPCSLTEPNFELGNLDEVKTLDIPDIYPVTDLDIKPEKVQFKHYKDIDAEVLNKKLNSHRSGDRRIHLVLGHFKDKKGWPDHSKYACWTCTEYFKEPPIGIPKITSSNNYREEYHLEGNFCSFNCAARNLFDTHNGSDNQLWTLYEILNYIYNTISDSKVFVKIKLAPERICLKKFGGHLTVEEYRQNHLTNVNYKVFKGQLIPSLYHIQENTDVRTIRSHTIGK